jgi:hypothetical protein
MVVANLHMKKFYPISLMPNRSTHNKISRMLVEDPCDRVHYVMDYPSRYLGRGHRILFHDPITAMLIGYSLKGKRGAASAIAHILTDYSVTELRSYLKRVL